MLCGIVQLKIVTITVKVWSAKFRDCTGINNQINKLTLQNVKFVKDHCVKLSIYENPTVWYEIDNFNVEKIKWVSSLVIIVHFWVNIYTAILTCIVNFLSHQILFGQVTLTQYMCLLKYKSVNNVQLNEIQKHINSYF